MCFLTVAFLSLQVKHLKTVTDCCLVVAYRPQGGPDDNVHTTNANRTWTFAGNIDVRRPFLLDQQVPHNRLIIVVNVTTLT